MSSITRRSFVNASAAVLAGAAVLQKTHAAETIPGFDQTKTDYDRTRAWKPFSDR